MEQAAEVPRALKKSIVEIFPAATVAIVWGSSGKDFILGVSDTDMLIIGPRDDAVEEKLKRLHDAGGELDIDPIYVTQDDLDKGMFKGHGIGREYKFHKFDLYRIKTQGKLLVGDPNLIDLIPDVSLDDALADTLPHVRNISIPSMTEKLREAHDADQFLMENLDILLVIARALYSIETKEYGSKIAALEHLKGQHPELADVLERLRQIYLKQSAADEPIPVRDVRAFLDFAEKTIDGHLQGVSGFPKKMPFRRASSGANFRLFVELVNSVRFYNCARDFLTVV